VVVGHDEIIDVLITNDTDVNAKTDDGRTALDLTYIKAIKDLLRKHGGKYGTIHTAAGSGDVEAVREFLDAGVDVDAKGESGETPLLHATFNSHKEIAELLVAEGADVNKKLWNGKTLLHQFIDARLPTGFFPLGIVEWLINNGADVNAEYGHGVTPLFLAVQAWSEEVVQLLID
ncbi:MAG: ankyrin repeat domain-containing protein, partial [Pirellulales bacterium]|nr:ankyrin repeat domain-containing protein [Pirellulales bacterium]